MNLSIEENIVQKTAVFKLNGKIASDIDAIELKEKTQKSIGAEIITDLLFDLKKLEYLTSSGLNFFVQTYKNCQQKNIQMGLCNLNDKVSKLIILSKLNELFTIYPSLEEGLAKNAH
jgi:anti-sigma B factor antagonist